MLKSLLRFFWRRDSERACILVIELCEYMDVGDLRQMADYCKVSSELKERETCDG